MSRAQQKKLRVRRENAGMPSHPGYGENHGKTKAVRSVLDHLTAVLMAPFLHFYRRKV